MTEFFSYREIAIEYEVIKTKNKHTYVRVRDGKVIVSLSKYNSISDTTNILISSYNFIASRLKKKSIVESEIEKNCDFFLFGKKYALSFSGNIKSYAIREDIILISDKLNEKSKIEEMKLQILSNELLREIEVRSKFLLTKVKLDFKPIFKISRAKSYFGNCNIRTKVIKINLFLARVDLKFLNLILCHEISHFFEMNHQKGFYRILSNLCPNHREINRELKEIYRTMSNE